VTSDTAITLFCQGALAGRFDDALGGLEVARRAPIERLMRRSRLAVLSATAADAAPTSLESPEEQWLRSRFGAPDEASIAAYEAAAAAGDGGLPAGWIIRPCSLHVGLDHLVLLPPAATGLSATESDALLEASTDWLADEPVRLDAIAPGLWRLTELEPQRTRFGQMRGASSRQACGRNIDVWLPSGEGARAWRRLANELQMLWHQHPVNLRRSETGQPVVNGLWFEGQTLPLSARPFDLIVSDDPVLAGLARISGARALPAAATEDAIAALSKQSATRPAVTRVLIDPGCWSEAQIDQDAGRWCSGWRDFAQWFEGFDARVGPGRSAGLDWLLTGTTRSVQLQIARRGLLRFWRDSAPQRCFEID
jgi:hypothetical protein